MSRVRNVLWLALVGGLWISNSLVYTALGLLFLLWLWVKTPFGRTSRFFYPTPTRKAIVPRVLSEFRKPVFLLLFLFVLWRLLSTFFSISWQDSLLVLPSLGIFMMIIVSRDAYEDTVAITAGVAAGSIACIYAICRYVRFMPEHAEGFYGGYSMFATFLAMNLCLLPALFFLQQRGLRRGLTILALFLYAVALVFTLERGPWLGALVGLIVTGILMQKRKFWMATALFFALLVLGVWIGGLTGPVVSKIKALLAMQSSGRLILWKATLPLVWAHPWLGVGPNTFRLVAGEAIKAAGDPGISGCHNDFLQTAFESGLPALALYLGFWVLIFKTALQVYKTTAGNDRMLLAGIIGVLVSHVVMSFFGTGLSDMVMIYLTYLMGIVLNLGTIQPEREAK